MIKKILIPVCSLFVLAAGAFAFVKFNGKENPQDTLFITESLDQNLPATASQAQPLLGFASSGDAIRYYYEDGTFATGPVQIDGADYLFTEDGTMETGWQTLEDQNYYYNPDGKRASGQTEIDGVTYQFQEDGRLLVGIHSETDASKWDVHFYNTTGQEYDQQDVFDQINSAKGVLEQPGSMEDTAAYMEEFSGKSESLSQILGYADRKPLDIQTSAEWKKVREAKDALLENVEVSFVMLDLNTGRGISYNPDEMIYTASSEKGPSVASSVHDNPEILDSQINLIQAILYYSDNYSYDTLWDRYAKRSMVEWCENAGVRYENHVHEYSYMSARQMAKLWTENYFYFQTDAVGNRLSYEYQQPETSSIHKVLGEKYRTQSKGGWFAGRWDSTCDCGIVYAGEHEEFPYLISIMTSVPCNMDRLDGLVEALDDYHTKMVSEPK